MSTALTVPELNDADLAFPAHALDWMPPWDEIPDEFKERRDIIFHEIARAWFMQGLPERVKFYPRKGVDAEQAVRAIQATLGSYAPKHEHKMAAAAYMLSCWFEKIEDWK